MIRAPNVPVTATISVPGEATARASVAPFSVTALVVLALTTRMRIELPLPWRAGAPGVGDSAAATDNTLPSDTAAPAARKLRRSDSGDVTIDPPLIYGKYNYSRLIAAR